MKKYLEFIRSIDVFGGMITFRINGRNKQKSFLGGFTTILVGILFLILSYIFSKDLIQKENPRNNFVRYYHPDNVSINFTDLNSLNMIVLICKDEGSKCAYKYNESIFKLRADYVTVTMKNDSRNYESISLNTSNCRKENFNKDLHDKFDELSLSNAICINSNNSIIYGQYESQIFKYIRIRLIKCYNTSEESCLSDEKIQEELGLWRMSFYYSFELENIKNYLNPKVNVIGNYGFTLSYDVYKRTNIFFQNNTLITDENNWIENFNNINKSIITYDSKYDEFQQNSPTSTVIFAGVFIRVSPIQNVFHRVYKKVPNIFAEVAGVLNYTFFILFVFFYFYNILLLKINLFNDFDFYNIKLEKKEIFLDDFLNSFTSFKRNNVVNSSDQEDSNSNYLKNTSILSKEGYRKRTRLNSFNIITYQLLCCKNTNSNTINSHKIYNEINNRLIEKLDLFNYISLQNKFYFLCKFILDDDQYILFNTLNRPHLFLDQNNDLLTEDFDNDPSETIKQKAIQKIVSRQNKSKIDNILLYFNNKKF